MEARFLKSGRTGFYMAVIQEGELGSGDAVELIERGRNQISIATVLRLYLDPETRNAADVRRVLEVEALPSGWRRRFLKRLEGL